MRKTIRLYRGDNGTQEFWKSEDNLLLAKAKNEDWWVAYQEDRLIGGAGQYVVGTSP